MSNPTTLENAADPALRRWPIAALFLAVLAALAVLAYPANMRFGTFAHGDPGATLVVADLEAQGLQPGVDFGQPYGLLTLLIGRAWFSAFGKTPGAYLAMMAACNLLMGWGLARLATALRAGPAGLALMLVSLVYLAPASYPGPVYALEAVLLCHALAEHASGRRGTALALTTACSLVKPTMAYVYGLLLVVLIIWHALRPVHGEAGPGRWSRLRGALRALAVSAGLWVALAGLLASIYGTASLVDSLLWPFARGAAHYRIEGFGFFHGAGRNFWLPSGVRPGYYVGTIAGLWLAASLVLAADVAGVAWRWVRGRAPGANAAVQACCAAMHAAYAALFFAHVWSWWYYFYVLIGGVVAGSRRSRASAAATWLLAALAVLPAWGRVGEYRSAWRDARPFADTGGLWFSSPEREAWARVLSLGEGRRPVFLNFIGCADLLSPEFQRPTTLWLYRGIALPAEVRRKRDQIARSTIVVVAPKTTAYPSFFDYWPEFAADLANWEEVPNVGAGWRIFRRRRQGSDGIRPRPGSS